MSIDNETNPAETDDVNLDDFSAEFFGQNEAAPEKTKPEEVQDEDDSNDAPPEDNQDTQDNDDDEDDTSPVDDEDPEDEPEKEEEPAPKPKKNSAQERISELTAARREAERRADALEARLAAIEAKSAPKDETPAPAPKAEAEGASPPKPTDMNEDGTEKYPLGEFDPNFITDLADFRVDMRLAAAEQQRIEAEQRRVQQEAMGQIETEWNGQLDSARERYPDFGEKLEELQPTFSNIDPNYGEYLGNTLMSMEKGADILYYLANNPDEAQAIVESGPQRATIALGRLEARFLEDKESAPVRRTSKAPPPPPTNKGASIARGKITPDTDDLDSFETLFFNKK